MRRKNNAAGMERLKIGSYIRKWRNIKDIKQKDLASALRLSEAAMSNIENDMTDLNLSQIEDIAITLDITMEQLFANPEENLDFIKKQTPEKEESMLMEKELIYALIGSIREKDEQLNQMVQQMVCTLDKLLSRREEPA
ncbi:MAG: helix-turn-helix domain-containing protein [Ferruginibacter sp.]